MRLHFRSLSAEFNTILGIDSNSNWMCLAGVRMELEHFEK